MERQPILPEQELDYFEKVFSEYMKDFELTQEDLQEPILDVGAGTGAFIDYVRNTLGNKKAFGLEKNSSKVSPESEGMVIADGFEIPFADDTFKIVISRNFIPMFADNPDLSIELLNELIRVVQKDGKVIGNITTPEIDSDESKLDIYQDSKPHLEMFKHRIKGSKEMIERLSDMEKEGAISIDYNRKGNRMIVTITKK